MDWFKLDRPALRRFGMLAVGGLIYVLPIVLADRYYQDDLARSLYGATGWAGDGRPLTEWLMQLLSGGQATIVDLYPLPLFLGIAVLAYAMTLYARQAFPDWKGSALLTVALGLVVAQPFAMANLSYRFDSLTMLLALALCFVLYALSSTLGGLKLALAGAVIAMLVMGLYQPASGMFLVLAGIWLVFWLLDWLGSTKPLREQLPAFWTEVWRLGGVGAGALFYLLAIAPRFVDSEGWRQEASQTVGGADALGKLVTNTLSAAYYIRERMRMAPLLYRFFSGSGGCRGRPLFAVAIPAQQQIQYRAQDTGLYCHPRCALRHAVCQLYAADRFAEHGLLGTDVPGLRRNIALHRPAVAACIAAAAYSGRDSDGRISVLSDLLHLRLRHCPQKSEIL